MLKGNHRNTFLHKNSKGPLTSHQIPTQSVTGKETLALLILRPPSHASYLPCSSHPGFFLELICVACLGSTLEKRNRHDNVCHFLHVEGGLHGRGPTVSLAFPPVRGRKDSTLLPQGEESYFTPDMMCYKMYKSSTGAREGQLLQ